MAAPHYQAAGILATSPQIPNKGLAMATSPGLLTLLAHAHPKALLEATVLTLVPVVLINLTVTVGPGDTGQGSQ